MRYSNGWALCWLLASWATQLTYANHTFKILALFSSSSKELGVSHHIGRHVLQLALNKARTQYAGLLNVQLDLHYDASECDINNTIPVYLAELFYENQNENRNNRESEELERVLVAASSRRQRRNSDAELVRGKRVDAILGPSCDYLVDLVARMAAYWEIPVYSVASMSARFGKKDVYSTLTRLSPSSEHLSIFILQIMAEFRWRHMAILADVHHPESSIMLVNMKRTLSRMRYVIPVESQTFHLSEHSIAPVKSVNSTSFCTPEVKDSLQRASKVARVILLLLGARGSTLRSFLLCASELKMSNGEYTFVALDLGLRSSESSSGDTNHARESQNFDWYSADDEPNNLMAKQMFESFMVVSVDVPISDDYRVFVEQAIELANQVSPELKLARSNFGALTLALHDSLLVACEAFLRSSRELPSRRLLNPMWNETYNSGLIPGLNINANGDQELDYVLSDFEPDLGAMRPVAIYQRDRRRLKLLPDSYIHWPKRTNQFSGGEANRNEPPPDEPECGFDGLAEKCVDRQSMQAAMMTVAALAILLLGASGFSVRQYRRIKYEMRLDDYWWKITWEDLQFVTAADSLVSQSPQALARSILSGGDQSSRVSSAVAGRKRSPREAGAPATGGASRRPTQVPRIVTSDSKDEHVVADDRRSTHSSVQELTQNRVFSAKSKLSSVVRESKLAMYKHELVIVKQLNADNLEVSRELLVDLKSMRDHVQDNLARFVGLCLEPGRLSIVYEFCSRGSLQEMLLNGNVAMDWTLKYSIIGDLISGLNFIHSTQLDFHGRLKSNNLVIDSRFTLKITDFGLQNLYNQLEASKGEADSESDSDGGGDDASSIGGESVVAESVVSRRSGRHQQPDLLSLSVSQRGANTAGRHGTSSSGGLESRRGRIKNRHATRYFWTAPEHLREKNVHFVGSKQGDVYSLGIILYELVTRREPYFYGTNAQPHVEAVEVERALTGQHTATSGSKLGPPTSASRSGRHSIVESATGSAKRLGSAISRHVQRGSGGRVGPADDAGSVVSGADGQTGSQVNRRASAVSSALGSKRSYNKAKRIDAEEILDQLRMGVQPEPVRPHIPEWVLADVNLRLLDLMRTCWSEAPGARPTLNQVRQSLKRITRGMATRNYLDNLLERLQNYATDLERIVDAKTSDITEEKARTEGLLYQLVPKFVAEKLKRAESIEPQLHDCVTVFFSDIVGFEKYSTMMTPAQLVDLLNCVYLSFESIINSFDVTKVETIIDQFLIASGISFGTAVSSIAAAAAAEGAESAEAPAGAKQGAETEGQKQSWNKFKIKAMTGRAKSTDQAPNAGQDASQQQPTQLNQPDMTRYKRASAEQIARMALCLRDMVKSAHFRQQLQQSAACIANAFNIRMGIHSGKVCTGLVGVHRPKFCLIGDTVNVASRMHTNSKANRIQISESTKTLLESVPGLSIEPRGKIEVKGKGEMDTFWLEEAY